MMKIGLILMILLVAVTTVLQVTGITAMSPVLTFIAALSLFLIFGFVAMVVAAKNKEK